MGRRLEVEAPGNEQMENVFREKSNLSLRHIYRKKSSQKQFNFLFSNHTYVSQSFAPLKVFINKIQLTYIHGHILPLQETTLNETFEW